MHLKMVKRVAVRNEGGHVILGGPNLIKWTLYYTVQFFPERLSSRSDALFLNWKE